VREEQAARAHKPEHHREEHEAPHRMRAHPVDETRPRLLQLVFGAFVHLADDLLHRPLELRAQSGRTVMHEIGDDRIVLRPVALRASARAQCRGQVGEVPLQRLQYLDGGRASSRQEVQQ